MALPHTPNGEHFHKNCVLTAPCRAALAVTTLGKLAGSKGDVEEDGGHVDGDQSPVVSSKFALRTATTSDARAAASAGLAAAGDCASGDGSLSFILLLCMLCAIYAPTFLCIIIIIITTSTIVVIQLHVNIV
jgi:hypothetical protein